MKSNFNTSIPKEIIFWGGTGQAVVNRDIVELLGSKLIAIFDDTKGLASPFKDVPLFTGWEGFLSWKKGKNNFGEVGFCIAIGNPHGRVRMMLHDKLVAEGLKPVSLIHPQSIIAKDVIIGEGVQIMAGAIIQPQVKIGKQCIINTKASVDHDCDLADGTEIGPGATLCGNIHTGVNTWVCAGATVLPRIIIGADVIVGAGAVVNRNIDPKNVVAGVPARKLRDL